MRSNGTVERPGTLLESDAAMITATRLNPWRSFLLGAANGLIYALVMYFLITMSRAYFQGRYLRQVTSAEFPVVQFASNERWTGIVIALVVLFALSTYIVSRVSHLGLRFPFFWVVVGLIAVSGWNVFMLIVTSLEKEASVQTLTYNWVTSPSNPLYGPISLGMVLTVNLFYGCAIRYFAKNAVVGVD